VGRRCSRRHGGAAVVPRPRQADSEGLYRSTTRRLNFPSGQPLSRSGVFRYDYRVGDPTTAAFMRCVPLLFENPLVDEASRKFLEWRFQEATQKSWLEWEATQVRKDELWEARAGEEVDEALDQLPAVDYSGVDT
jgi:hypothetical protein